MANQEDQLRLEAIAKRTSFKNIYQFPLSTDRHLNRYTIRQKDFPEKYHPYSSMLEWGSDPDWEQKIGYTHFPLKMVLFLTCSFLLLIQWKALRVESFDKLKRRE